MKIIIGGYSQYSFGSNESNYEKVLDNSLKPILTYLYHNPSFKFILRLSTSEIEWLDNKHPDMIMLIKELCNKGQLELLASSYYDSIISMVPNRERSIHIERSTMYLRKKFSKKPHGVWCNFQVFNPAIIPLTELSSLDYVIISRHYQASDTTVSTKPFIMDEMGSKAFVFTFDDSLNSFILDYEKNIYKESKFKENLKKFINSSNQLSTYMLNLDTLSEFNNIVSVYNLIFNQINTLTILPTTYINNYQINKLGYLPSGIYGKDYSLGKALSINQKIFESSILTKNYMIIASYSNIIKDIKKSNENKLLLDELLLEASSSALYIPDTKDFNDYLEYCSSKICEIEKILISMNLLPNAINNHTSSYSKNYVAFFSNKGSYISKLNYINSYHDFTLNCDNGIFYDDIKDLHSNKVLNLSNKIFDVTCNDKKRIDFVSSLKHIDFLDKEFSIIKNYKFRQNYITVTFSIQNIGNTSAKDLYVDTYFNLYLDNNSKFDLDKPVSNIICSSKKKDYVLSCSFSEETNVTYRNVIGNDSRYLYTQFRFQKPINLEPNETITYNATIKVDRYKEINNDIK